MEQLVELDVDWDVCASMNGQGHVLEFHWSRKDARSSKASHLRQVTPFVFRASLGYVRSGRRSSGTGFAEFETEDDVIVPMSMQGVSSLFREIRNDRIQLTDDRRFQGLYYLRKKGKGVSVCALPREKAREFSIE